METEEELVWQIQASCMKLRAASHLISSAEAINTGGSSPAGEIKLKLYRFMRRKRSCCVVGSTWQSSAVTWHPLSCYETANMWWWEKKRWFTDPTLCVKSPPVQPDPKQGRVMISNLAHGNNNYPQLRLKHETHWQKTTFPSLNQ